MPTIYIENTPYTVPAGENLLSACLGLGFDLPYFCWHPALHSAGACRQCAVKQFKDEKDTRGRIVMACMTPVEEGMRISIADPEAAAFRRQVIEWLMTNHPHDCPVCDEGGECHLQDMTVLTGHYRRRCRFPKRTHRNQYLGPFVHHEMNRCIQCYRCLRFYRDYAGGRDLQVFSAHHHVYFGRHADGPLESPFSGNLVEVCPTGVFTDKVGRRRYARKWDLQTAPSLCLHCGLGCNILPGERYGRLRRVLNRFHPDLNGHFLCDRGRFGHEYTVQPTRRRQAALLGREARADEVLKALEPVFRAGGRVIGIGSPRATLEANHLLRQLVGVENFFAGLAPAEHRLLRALVAVRGRSVPCPSLREIALGDAALVLGEDLPATAPLAALALRQTARRAPVQEAVRRGIPAWHDLALREMVQERKGPLFAALPYRTALDEIFTAVHTAHPLDLARLGLAVAAAIDPGQASPADLPPELRESAQRIAAALLAAARPMVLGGCGCGEPAVIEAAHAVAAALQRRGKEVGLALFPPECNSLGLALLGGRPLDEAREIVGKGEAAAVIVLENDLFRRLPEHEAAAFFGGRAVTVVIDHLHTACSAAATFLLPAAVFAESNGTLVNYEGRVQPFYRVYPPEPPVRESREWLAELAQAAGRSLKTAWPELLREMAACAPLPAGLEEMTRLGESEWRIARQSARASGRTAQHAARSVHEPQPPSDEETPFAFSMEGYAGTPPAGLLPRYQAPGWNSGQALHKFPAETTAPRPPGGAHCFVAFPPPAETGPTAFPAPFSPPAQGFTLIPLPLFFGGDELSAHAPATAERMPPPFIGLDAAEAARIGAAPGDILEIRHEERTFSLPWRPLPGLPAGVAALPPGLPGVPVLPAGTTVALTVRRNASGRREE